MDKNECEEIAYLELTDAFKRYSARCAAGDPVVVTKAWMDSVQRFQFAFHAAGEEMLDMFAHLGIPPDRRGR